VGIDVLGCNGHAQYGQPQWHGYGKPVAFLRAPAQVEGVTVWCRAGKPPNTMLPAVPVNDACNPRLPGFEPVELADRRRDDLDAGRVTSLP
jgi:hypothetical protein